MQFRQLACLTSERMADQQDVVSDEEVPDGYARPEIDRANLNRLLLASLASSTVSVESEV